MNDPQQYAVFRDERSRGFFNLLERVPDVPYENIVDLGCGGGELTVSLAQRWPKARVIGLDNSPQMLAGAERFADPGRLEFLHGDIAAYDQPADLIYSNAALHWLPDHESLFPHLASLVKPGGVFAVQMPSNFNQPSHRLVEQTARSGPWAAKLEAWQPLSVKPLTWYEDLLLSLGFSVDAWQTTYHQLLQGEDPVVEFLKGSYLQPIFSLLDESEQQEFLSIYTPRAREAYPPHAYGTIFPFDRIFFVARRPA